MSGTTALPNHLRPRREKLFGDGRPRPLDRNGKVRVMTFAWALMRRTEPGKHYGAITAKALAVLEALLWGFHNARSGLCFPSYETIAEKAGCARSTVAEAIKALEDAGQPQRGRRPEIAASPPALPRTPVPLPWIWRALSRPPHLPASQPRPRNQGASVTRWPGSGRSTWTIHIRTMMPLNSPMAWSCSSRTYA
jgi:hypothetical protein